MKNSTFQPIQLLLIIVLSFIFLISFALLAIATPVFNDNVFNEMTVNSEAFTFQFDLERLVDNADAVDRESALQIHFIQYDSTHGSTFQFTTNGDARLNIHFSHKMIQCHEVIYPSTITVNEAGDTMDLTFQWDEKTPIPADFICTIDIVNPHIPIDTAQISVQIHDVVTSYPLPKFALYYADRIEVSSFQLNSPAEYSFHILPQLPYKSNDKIVFKFDEQYGIQYRTDTTVCTDQNAQQHSFIYDTTSKKLIITLATTYQHDTTQKIKISCPFTNPIAETDKQYYALISDFNALYQTFPLILPTFGRFDIHDVQIVPFKTTIGELIDFTIKMNLEQYYPSPKDTFHFTTWFPVADSSTCQYGEGSFIQITLDKNGFSFSPKNDWLDSFPDTSNIVLQCSGAVVKSAHVSSTGSFSLITQYQTSYADFTLPMFMNNWLILFSASSYIPQAENVQTTWSVYTTEQTILESTRLSLNATSVFSAQACEKVTFEIDSLGLLVITIPPNSLTKQEPFVFSCKGKNQLFDKSESQIQYKLFSDTQQLDQSYINIPAYRWSTTSNLSHQIQIEGAVKNWSNAKISTLLSIISKTLNISQDTFFIASYTTDNNTDDKSLEALLDIVYLQESQLYPDQLDDLSDDLENALRTSSYNFGTKISITYSVSTFEYPDHCIDGKFTAYAESTIDCGQGPFPELSGKHSCKPCAADGISRCYKDSHCLSQQCLAGRCLPFDSHDNSVQIFNLVIIAFVVVIGAVFSV